MWLVAKCIATVSASHLSVINHSGHCVCLCLVSGTLWKIPTILETFAIVQPIQSIQLLSNSASAHILYCSLELFQITAQKYTEKKLTNET